MIQEMKIICLCGSTKFKKEIKQIEEEQKALGNIILSVVFSPFDDTELDEETVMRLNRLHRAKIDCADKLIIINVEGYIGNGLKDEITYADMVNKPYVYLEDIIAHTADKNRGVREAMKCEDCYNWMKKSLCSRERSGTKVVCNDIICKEFVLGKVYKQETADGTDNTTAD